MSNSSNLQQLGRARRRTIRFAHPITYENPIWNYVEHDVTDPYTVNCKHCDASWRKHNESTTNYCMHVMRRHLNIVTDADYQRFVGHSRGRGATPRTSLSARGRHAETTEVSAMGGAETTSVFVTGGAESTSLSATPGDLDEELALRLTLSSENFDSSDAIDNVQVTDSTPY